MSKDKDNVVTGEASVQVVKAHDLPIVKAEVYMVEILQTLITNREQIRQDAEKAVKKYQTVQQQINTYLSQCAVTLHLDPTDYTFSDKDLGFVPKPLTEASVKGAVDFVTEKDLAV